MPTIKRFLPLFLLLAGAIVVTVVFFLARGGATEEKVSQREEEEVLEIPIEKRPVASLTPSKDGHWLKLSVEGLKKSSPYSLDYELLYELPDGRTQGIPGTVIIGEEDSLERNLLLGSESSGKFRYDEGVEKGTLTLRFRNEKGKLIGKLSTGFHLQVGEKELTSVDGKFKFVLAKVPKGVYFVTMETFGLEEIVGAAVRSDSYAIFSSSEAEVSGKVE